MNWYKQAISESDFYKFYAYSGLTEGDLKDNPVLLYEMIEHLNYIRNYYLEYLVKEISEELEYGFDMIIFTEHYSKVAETKERLRILIDKLNTNPQSKDIKEAAGFFYDYIWDECFGGRSWALVSLWALRLFDFGEIMQQTPHTALFNRVSRLIMIIDTIHSLEHNTNNLLIDLPEEEKDWLFFALEVVKYSPDFSNLAALSKDSGLMNFYQRNRALSKTTPANISGLFLNSFEQLFKGLLNNNDINERDLADRVIFPIRNTNSLEKLKYFLEAAKKINTKDLSADQKRKWTIFWELVASFGITANVKIYSNNDLFVEYRRFFYQIQGKTLGGGSVLGDFLKELRVVFPIILMKAQTKKEKIKVDKEVLDFIIRNGLGSINLSAFKNLVNDVVEII